MPITRCNTTSTTSIINVIDNVNHQQNSSPISVAVSNANVNIGTVQACGIIINEFLTYTINGITYNPDSVNIQTIGTLTKIFGGVKSKTYRFNGNFSGLTIGNYSMNLVKDQSWPNYFYWRTDAAHTMNVSITEYGNVGQYVAGSFTGTVYETVIATNNPISGSFRIKRTQ